MRQILIVEDDLGIRQSLHWLLEDEGYTLHEVNNGTEALAFLRKIRQPMVVLLDVIMPGMDGIALMEAVLREPKLQRHYYIIMTATAGSYSTELTKIRRQMPISLMHKPFELDRFLTLVNQHAK